MPIMLLVKALFGFFIDNWKPILFAIIVACAYVAGVKSSSASWESKINRERIVALEAAKKKEVEYTANANIIATKFEEYRKAHPVINTKEVIKYVSKDSDSHCIINVGFVRLHNKAAGDVSADSGSQSNDSASQLSLSTVGEVVSSNYNTCLIEMEKLKALQETVKQYQDIQLK